MVIAGDNQSRGLPCVKTVSDLNLWIAIRTALARFEPRFTLEREQPDEQRRPEIAA